jgi:hypothetical protein
LPPVDQGTFWKRLIESLDYPRLLVLPSLLPLKALMPPQLHMLGSLIQKQLQKMLLNYRQPRLFWEMM